MSIVYWIVAISNIVAAAMMFLSLITPEGRARPLTLKLPIAGLAVTLALYAAILIGVQDPQEWRRWILTKETIVSVVGAAYIVMVILGRFREKRKL